MIGAGGNFEILLQLSHRGIAVGEMDVQGNAGAERLYRDIGGAVGNRIELRGPQNQLFRGFRFGQIHGKAMHGVRSFLAEDVGLVGRALRGGSNDDSGRRQSNFGGAASVARGRRRVSQISGAAQRLQKIPSVRLILRDGERDGTGADLVRRFRQ